MRKFENGLKGLPISKFPHFQIFKLSPSSMKNIIFTLLLISSMVACQQMPSEEKEQHVAQQNHRLEPIDDRFGELFEAIQLAAIFPDSKTFSDCSPKMEDEKILANYARMKDQPDFDLASFVEVHFDKPKQYASGFQADTSRDVTAHIQALWPVLTRQPDQTDRGTLIPLPHPYIVPGGRFGEIYYWDSYFTMLGLQVAGKQDMIGHMLDNFAYLIDTIGHIPNGNRTYFLGRSQPPFFAMMVRLLAEDDETALARYYPALQKEYAFWIEGADGLEAGASHRRVVRLADGRLLNRYWDDYPEPRPESYKEDVHLANASEREKEQLFYDIRAACESGWDFSSRWFRDPQELSTIHTTEILPVDLNCLIWNLENTLADAAIQAGDTEAAKSYKQAASERAHAVQSLFWNPEKKYFFDYDYVAGKHKDVISMAGAFPLLMELATEPQAEGAKNMLETELLQPGGFLSTTNQNGEQWDAPNGWAPLQWVGIKGLRNYEYFELADEAKSRWIALNRRVYKNTGKMVEKYNVVDMDLLAGGGEYPVQDGFGWSNGVLLRLMEE